jgi:hypothetical protein
MTGTLVLVEENLRLAFTVSCNLGTKQPVCVSIYLIKCVTRICICRMDRFTAVNPPVGTYRWHLEITRYGTVRRRLYAVRHL